MTEPLTFAATEQSPLSIRASALVFIDEQSRRVRDAVEALAQGPLPILITGETGTGKELLARHVHKQSGRCGLFVSVNCAALSPRFAEAELFGQANGERLNGASGRMGWLGSANGGTLYLDELADLSLSLQEKLLQVLQCAQVLRVGALKPTDVDVRLVAGSSVDLDRAVAAGRVDAKLYQYLNQTQVQLPPLRERLADIVPMAEYFLGVYSQRFNVDLPELSQAAQQLLEQYPWPGNTRELENAIHVALLQASGGVLTEQDLMLSDPMRFIKPLLARLSAGQRLELRDLLKQI